MKKQFSILILVFSLFTTFVFAQTNSAELDKEKIEEIKKKVSSKVSSLQVEAAEVLNGFFKSVSEDGKIIELTDEDGELQKANVDDEITKFYKVLKSKVQEDEKKNLEKGDYLVVYGNKVQNDFQAINFFKEKLIKILSGTIVDINKDEFALVVIDDEGEEITVDIEKFTTKKIIKDKDFEFQKIGFSKIKENDKIIFSYTSTEEAELKRVSANKIIIIPQELLEKLRAEKSK